MFGWHLLPEEFQSPALCELVKAKSRELEQDNPAEAAEWAELARRMAEFGREDRRERQGAAPSSERLIETIRQA